MGEKMRGNFFGKLQTRKRDLREFALRQIIAVPSHHLKKLP